MTKNYQRMFNILEQYLNDKLVDVDKTVLQAVENRKNGKTFTFSEHLKGLVFSLLSSQRDWGEIHKNRQYIEKLFFNFDKEKIKDTDYRNFINGLKSRSLGNRAINKQMETLNYNISILERIENEYGSLDDFVTRLKPNAISALLACKESPYALKQIGFPLALEYLRNVGIDTVKPDVHIVRIFKKLGLIKDSSSAERDVLEAIEKLSKESGYSKAHIDFLLWHYCSKSFGNICSENNPKCDKCVIREFCNNQDIRFNDKEIEKKIIVVKKAINIVEKNDTKKIFNKKISVNKEQDSQIIQEIEEFLSNIPIGYVFSTGWFKDELSQKYKRPRDSYIPSDYCYNRTNRGIQYEKQPHYFLFLERGKYQYKGKNYNYQGIVETDPRY